MRVLIFGAIICLELELNFLGGPSPTLIVSPKIWRKTSGVGNELTRLDQLHPDLPKLIKVSKVSAHQSNSVGQNPVNPQVG